MGFGEPKMPTREDMAKIQKERTINDAELLKDGAEYQVDESGNSILTPTGEQFDSAKNEMGEAFHRENIGLKKENTELMEKNAELMKKLEDMETRMKKINELTNNDSTGNRETARIVFGPTKEELNEIGEDVKEMSKSDFESQYGSGVESVGVDPRVALKDLDNLDNTYLSDPLKYLEKISKAIDDENKDVIVVENHTYIVDKK